MIDIKPDVRKRWGTILMIGGGFLGLVGGFIAIVGAIGFGLLIAGAWMYIQGRIDEQFTTTLSTLIRLAQLEQLAGVKYAQDEETGVHELWFQGRRMTDDELKRHAAEQMGEPVQSPDRDDTIEE